MYVLFEPFLLYFAVLIVLSLVWAILGWHGVVTLIGPAIVVLGQLLAMAIRWGRGQSLVQWQSDRVAVWILAPAIITPVLALIAALIW